MNYSDKKVTLGLGDDTINDESSSVLESQLVAIEDRIRELPEIASEVERAGLQLQLSRALVGLDRGQQAWDIAHECFDIFLQNEKWEQAVEACDLMFLSDQPHSLIALGQGIWLAVTFPIDPELTLALLQHVVDETPEDSDGAAVAAAAGIYVVDLRAEGKQREDLQFFANRMLGAVARRHSEIESQEQFDFWVAKLELDQPEKFLVRLRNVVDVLVQDDWWFDRDKIHETIPVN